MNPVPYSCFIILSGCNPRYPSESGCGEQPFAHGALATALVDRGFIPDDGRSNPGRAARFIETAGRYGGQYEPGYAVETRTTEERRTLVRLARAFGQESVLYVCDGCARFWYINGPDTVDNETGWGPMNVGTAGMGFTYGPSIHPPPGRDNYSVVNVRVADDALPVPVYFAYAVGAD